MVRIYAAVTVPAVPRVRHYVGFPDAPDRRELPRPTVALIDEKPDGFYLVRLTNDGTFCGDTWHPTNEEARGQAQFEFELVGDWRDIPVDVPDAESYAIQHVKIG
jgi:hypothetical protein